MSNTDLSQFVSLYNYIVKNNIYIPNQIEEYYIIELQQTTLETKKKYQKFIIGYDNKIHILKLDYNWIYYYIYIILFCDFGVLIDSKLYDEIIDKIVNGEFLKQDKINAIKQVMLKCGETPDIINGWMEGSIVYLVKMIIELDMEEEFNKIVTDIKNSTLESYRDIIPYLSEIMDNVKDDKKYKKYFDILNQ
jgi:hypothetical protein